MIELFWVRVPTTAAGEFSFPESVYCAGSYFGIRSAPCYRSSTYNTATILPKVQVAGYSFTHAPYVYGFE